MPLTYDEQAQLMNDMNFRGRVKVACLTFADYISDEASSAPAHTTRYRWAQSVFQTPDMVAQNVTPLTVREPQVVQDGAKVSDPDLQTAVETAVNKML